MVPNHQPVLFRVLHRFTDIFQPQLLDSKQLVGSLGPAGVAVRHASLHGIAGKPPQRWRQRRERRAPGRGQVMIQLWLKPMDWSTGKIYTSTIKYKGFLL